MIVFTAVPQRASTGVAFAPDSLHLATATDSYSMLLWNLAGKPTVIRQWPGIWGTSLSFSPDGRFLARGPLVRVWEVEGDDTPVLTHSGLASESLAFSPTGQEFALVSQYGVQRWAVPSWQPLPGVIVGRPGGLRSDRGWTTGGLAYSPDGSLLAVGFTSGTKDFTVLRLWELASWELRHSLRSPFSFDHPSVLRFSPDSRLLAAVYGPLLRIWDVANEKEIAVHKRGKKHLKGLAFTLDGQRLVAVSNDRTVRQWVAPEWTETTGYDWKIGKLVSLDVSRDGCRMAAGSGLSRVIVWDVD
jgi:WD40 repeat protein